jgi:hypothetical protein
MSTTHEDLSKIQQRVSAMASAPNPSAVFRLLLDASRLGASRSTIFLVRHGRLRGWGSRGYTADAAARLRTISIGRGDDSWLGGFLREETGEELVRGPEDSGPEFGQPASVETLGFPVRVRSKTLAVLMAERSADDPSHVPAVLKMLTSVACLRLELDLAWRKFRAAREEAAPAPARAATPAVEAPRTSDPAESATSETSLEPVERSDPAVPAGDARRNQARTFAKLVATDIRLYNEEAVMLGRQHRDLDRRLGEDLERGRDSFRRRFPDLGDEGMTLLQEAYVQVLAAGDPSLFTSGTA